MNTVLKRKLSSVIASESIVKNIGQEKYKNFCNTTYRNHNRRGNNTRDTNKNEYKKCRIAQTINNQEVNTYKRQKKTHYNEKMEPIKLSSTSTSHNKSKYQSETSNAHVDMPKRIREVVWNTYNGETYSSKCYVPWCINWINVFNYQVGHDIPESKGGTYDIGNLRPICSNCNLSMGNKWTIQEWGKLIIHDKLDDDIKLKNKMLENKMKKQDKIDLQVGNTITPETTYKITFITLLFLALNFMIF